MTSIRILHASDLHIAVADQRRSYVDAISDAVSSLPNLDPELTWIALRKLALASSYEPQVLEDLAEFIVNNVKGVKPDVAQLIESVAKQHDLVILNEKLDAIVLTGDLATTGLEPDLLRVHSFLKADYEPDTPHKPKDAASIIAAISAVNTDITPIACLPGNHDRYSFPRGLPTYMPGCRSFDTLLLDYQHQPVRKIVVPSNSDLKVVIFAADFTLRRLRDSKGVLGWIAQGKVYAERDNDILGNLVQQTSAEIASRKPNIPLCVLWAVHFPPDFPNQSKQHRLIDEKKLLDQADKLRVNGILAGHTHYQKKYRDKDPNKCPVFCCGTTAQHEPQTSIRNPAPEGPVGNLFQILTIATTDEGQIRIDCQDYHHSTGTGPKGTTPRHWRKYTHAAKPSI